MSRSVQKRSAATGFLRGYERESDDATFRSTPERLNEELGAARLRSILIRLSRMFAVQQDAAFARRRLADGVLFQLHFKFLNRAGLQADRLGRLCWTVHLGRVSVVGEGEGVSGLTSRRV